jgi:hypothetical protein
MTHALVPGNPSYLVACLDHDRVVVTDSKQVGTVVHALNGLKLVAQGAVWDCAL